MFKRSEGVAYLKCLQAAYASGGASGLDEAIQQKIVDPMVG
jgi:hypothetical protein